MGWFFHHAALIPIEIIVVDEMHSSSPDENNQKRSRRDWFVSSPAFDSMAAIRRLIV
jgi:hypothetical protein